MKHVVKDGRAFVCAECPTPEACGTGCQRIDHALDAQDFEPDAQVVRLTVNSGDVIVYAATRRLTDAQVARIRAAHAQVFPDNPTALVLDEGLSIEAVLEAGTPEARAATGQGG